jgi:Zn-dependent peptidase ImmA (M78 family)/transcriptional regulator with XRE-family HTH domain
MIGKRLQLSRRAAGLSLRDLEAKVDKQVSAQALSKYERDEMMPGSAVLDAIARALGVSESYLLGQNDLTLESVEFRKNKITSKKEEASIKASVLSAAERYLEIEDFVGLSSATWSRPQGAPFRVVEPADAEAAAMRLRTAWTLGQDPIQNLSEFLEEQGVKVIPLKLGEQVSGLMCVARRSKGEDVPIVIVNEDDTGERQRFTIAHEVGHLVLEGPEGAKGEKLAQCFAGAFLMPAEILWREVGKNRDSLSIGELIELKALFKTSLQAITYRLKDLQIIAEPLYKRLFDEFERRGWRKPPYAEPGAIAAERPERFKRLCYRAVSEGAVSEAKAAELLGVSVRELNRRLDSPA